MKAFYLTVATLYCLCISAHSQENPLFTLYGTKLVNDSAYITYTIDPEDYRPVSVFTAISRRGGQRKLVMHTTKKGKPVEAYFFPGLSDKKALIVGGMHGSELSSVEVARELIKRLSAGDAPYYNVVVVPSLFPDNAQVAQDDKTDRIANNTGRYTDEKAADPNRQMPPLGTPFSPEKPLDAMKRMVEGENAALLQLIQAYKPDRLISIHAIKDRSRAGVFADPRTDCAGYALGYETDEALALMMANHIQAFGGACPGNNLTDKPSALYYLDPPIAEKGQKQERSFNGSASLGRGQGVSLGSWSSTGVCDPREWLSRPPIRTFTMEFPGYLTPSEYKSVEDQNRYEKMVQLYAASIQHYFLHSFFVEGGEEEAKRFASQ